MVAVCAAIGCLATWYSIQQPLGQTYTDAASAESMGSKGNGKKNDARSF
jgi:hypothetical protein